MQTKSSYEDEYLVHSCTNRDCNLKGQEMVFNAREIRCPFCDKNTLKVKK